MNPEHEMYAPSQYLRLFPIWEMVDQLVLLVTISILTGLVWSEA